MEDVLDVYQRPYNPKRPVVNMDEHPVQLVKETRTPEPAHPGKPKRYEYERNGTGVVFMFTQPLAGWRKVQVRARRTALDWADEIEELLEMDYPEAETVVLVCDNLNTHTSAALYEAFPPEKARRLAKRLEFHYTPKHGSWLNVAEIELSVLSNQCLRGRIPDLQTLKEQTKAWQRERNQKSKVVNWQFTTDDARIKLKKLYPDYSAF
jgi:hypothetical protein